MTEDLLQKANMIRDDKFQLQEMLRQISTYKSYQSTDKIQEQGIQFWWWPEGEENTKHLEIRGNLIIPEHFISDLETLVRNKLEELDKSFKSL